MHTDPRIDGGAGAGMNIREPGMAGSSWKDDDDGSPVVEYFKVLVLSISLSIISFEYIVRRKLSAVILCFWLHR